MAITFYYGSGSPFSWKVWLALEDLHCELRYFEDAFQGDNSADQLSLTDVTLYPILALIKRLHDKQPQHAVGALLRPKLATFIRRIEQLAYFAKSFPPHWKAQKPMNKQTRNAVCNERMENTGYEWIEVVRVVAGCIKGLSDTEIRKTLNLPEWKNPHRFDE